MREKSRCVWKKSSSDRNDAKSIERQRDWQEKDPQPIREVAAAAIIHKERAKKKRGCEKLDKEREKKRV
jgi:hypothetical protein